MGLDTTHNAWHGGYGRFNFFRTKLAEIEGFNYNSMEGLGGSIPWTGVNSELKVLLMHSDCDGEIEWRDCKKIADRLYEIAKLPNVDNEFVGQCRKFADGCMEAFKAKENLEFN